MHAFTNGSTGHEADEAIDVLYSFWPDPAPAPQACPEALFSITLRGAYSTAKLVLGQFM